MQAYVGGELAARAAANVTDEQLRELEKIQTELEDAYAADDNEAAVRLNHEFHRAINVAADSPKLAQLMSQITRYAPESVFPDDRGLARAIERHHHRLSCPRWKPRRKPRSHSDVRAPRRGRRAADRPPHRGVIT